MAAALVLSLVLAPCFPFVASSEEPKSALPPNMAVVYMVLLKKGPSWTAQRQSIRSFFAPGRTPRSIPWR